MTSTDAARILAEYLLRDTFDLQRRLAGRDYGGGQRRKQLAGMFDAAYEAGEVCGLVWEDGVSSVVDEDDVLAAWRKIALPAIRRIERTSSGGAKLAALVAWRNTARRLAIPEDEQPYSIAPTI